MVKLLPARWETERCEVASFDADDAAARQALQALYEKSSYMAAWDGRVVEPDYIDRIAEGRGEVPPGGSQDRLLLQRIARKDDPERRPIGLLELYHGYPHERSLYIGFLFIDPVEQGNGCGREIASRCRELALGLGYEEARVAVALKNWPALRFWIRNGYRHATKTAGDRLFGEDAYAVLELSTSGVETADGTSSMEGESDV
ncbi:GNAT family N-acetyltransferase [Paenibacillus sp.]|uniref:GNAT family N-acetyltransferase n=1 Tax=Paenibacillus sp. TaxID=58172 RepID=UPI002D6484D0|nr:GNAT family N-acetyltransferase [Paenibacillus sp.]HZG87727.1 GNAT family N-acetyltransferase [Paenibacillus sp.]